MSELEDTVGDIEEYLTRHQEKELLRLVVVGSVDDGKSTLIGRLLHDTQGIYEDQLSAVKSASTQTGMEIDFSLFTDGLKAEREQGITIDVAYRYFSTDARKFIIGDTPGHVQYTRNMATGASTANVCLILIDSRLGVLQQSRRHAYIASLLGIPHLAVAVNKMDLPSSNQGVYDAIVEEFREFSAKLGFRDVSFMPISALRGDNVVERGETMTWYEGPTVLEYLETVPIAADRNLKDFRYPVQCVLRPNLDYRGFAAEISSGVVRKGDAVTILPSLKTTRVAGVDTYEGSIDEACAPMSVTLRLAEEVDVSRGDMIVHGDNLPQVERTFEAMVVWMSEGPLDLQKSYLLKHTTQMVRAEVLGVCHRTNLDTLAEEDADTLKLNDIGRVRVRCRRSLFFDAYSDNRKTGAFILIDSMTNATLAAGMIVSSEAAETGHEVVSSAGVGEKRSEVSPRERELRLGQKGAVLLLTGLPGAGKTDVARAVERLLYDRGSVGVVVDPRDQIASEVDENAHPAVPGGGAVEAARRLCEVGLVVLLPFAVPGQAQRAALAELVGEDRWIEVLVDTPEGECRERVAGDFFERHPEPSYDKPSKPDLVISLHGNCSVEGAASQVIELLLARDILGFELKL